MTKTLLERISIHKTSFRSSFGGRNVDTSHTASPGFVGSKGRIVREIRRHRGLSCHSRAL